MNDYGYFLLELGFRVLNISYEFFFFFGLIFISIFERCVVCWLVIENEGNEVD